jgi:branched-chain amino acid transport system ATP-binding protein
MIGEHAILKDVSLEVAKGEIVGLIGPNGSGKTTLFNVLSGFLKPTEGSIHYCGEDITSLAPSTRSRRGIGRVFQNFGVFRDMTLEENVLIAFESLPKEERRRLGKLREVTHETLRMAGLEHHSRKKAGTLSGGQMRLLEIARTFKSRKELFLLDEPTAGVSPKMTHQIANLIRELKKEGKTALVIEHDLPFIARVCDRVIVLDVGEVALEGAPAEIQTSKKLKEIYFGADPTT